MREFPRNCHTFKIMAVFTQYWIAFCSIAKVALVQCELYIIRCLLLKYRLIFFTSLESI